MCRHSTMRSSDVRCRYDASFATASLVFNSNRCCQRELDCWWCDLTKKTTALFADDWKHRDVARSLSFSLSLINIFTLRGNDCRLPNNMHDISAPFRYSPSPGRQIDTSRCSCRRRQDSLHFRVRYFRLGHIVSRLSVRKTN